MVSGGRGSCSDQNRSRLPVLVSLNPKPYLDPKEPTFLGFLIMISLYGSLER